MGSLILNDEHCGPKTLAKSRKIPLLSKQNLQPFYSEDFLVTFLGYMTQR